MAKMPAMLDAQKQLEKLVQLMINDYKKMVEEYQAKLKSTKLKLLLLQEVINGDRSKEVQDMQIVDYRDNAQKNYNKKVGYR
jgi:outer membrane protein